MTMYIIPRIWVPQGPTTSHHFTHKTLLNTQLQVNIEKHQMFHLPTRGRHIYGTNHVVVIRIHT